MPSRAIPLKMEETLVPGGLEIGKIVLKIDLFQLAQQYKWSNQSQGKPKKGTTH